MIRGQEYAWEDIQVVITGKVTPIVGITSIEYGTDKELDYVRGKGNDPLGLKRGNKSYPVSMTLLQSEFEALQASIPPGKDLTDLVMTATVAYAPAGGKVTTDQLLNIGFNKFSKPFKSGDGNMEIALTGMAVKINYNV